MIPQEIVTGAAALLGGGVLGHEFTRLIMPTRVDIRLALTTGLGIAIPAGIAFGATQLGIIKPDVQTVEMAEAAMVGYYLGGLVRLTLAAHR